MPDDAVRRLFKVGAGLIPVVGSAAAELIEMIEPPLRRRQEAWFDELAQRLAALEQENRLNRKHLESGVFLDALLRAGRAATSTREREKHEALRNALLNVAVAPESAKDLEHELFVRFLEDLDVWHLRFLHVLDDPAEWGRVHQVNMDSGEVQTTHARMLQQAFPRLAGWKPIYDTVWRDLYTRGLIDRENPHDRGWGGGAILERRTTDSGQAFLRFISEP